MKKNNHTAEIGLADQVLAVLKTHTQAGAFFLLALSGGVDSVVLLHVLHALRKKHAFKLHALHVHHGLSAFADDWAKHCQEICNLLDVPLAVVKVQVDRTSKKGIEAEARAKRYQALFSYRDGQQAPDFILTAHHEQDQAETLLLQLARGAGVKGLAGMAMADEKKNILRPLLQTRKSDILDYAQTHALHWCEDDSNDNTAFERNFLRHDILPVWAVRHPAIYQNIARSAAHFAEAAVLLDELAKTDGEILLNKNSLCLTGLQKLTLPRAKNVLRWWLGRFGIAMPNTVYLNQILTQLFSASNDARIALSLGDFALRRFNQRAYLCDKAKFNVTPFTWLGEESVALPQGTLFFKRTQGAGLLRINAQATLTIGFRNGGERIKTAENRPSRTLKYLMQENQIPPWARASWPLIYVNGQLACIPNVGVDAALQTQANEAGTLVFYQNNAPSFSLQKEP